jgi:hypothetical protein
MSVAVTYANKSQIPMPTAMMIAGQISPRQSAHPSAIIASLSSPISQTHHPAYRYQFE